MTYDILEGFEESTALESAFALGVDVDYDTAMEGQIWDAIKNVAKSIKEKIGEAIRKAVDFVGGLLSKIPLPDFIKNTLGWLKQQTEQPRKMVADAINKLAGIIKGEASKPAGESFFYDDYDEYYDFDDYAFEASEGTGDVIEKVEAVTDQLKAATEILNEKKPKVAKVIKVKIGAKQKAANSELKAQLYKKRGDKAITRAEQAELGQHLSETKNRMFRNRLKKETANTAAERERADKAEQAHHNSETKARLYKGQLERQTERTKAAEFGKHLSETKNRMFRNQVERKDKQIGMYKGQLNAKDQEIGALQAEIQTIKAQHTAQLNAERQAANTLFGAAKNCAGIKDGSVLNKIRACIGTALGCLISLILFAPRCIMSAFSKKDEEATA